MAVEIPRGLGLAVSVQITVSILLKGPKHQSSLTPVLKNGIYKLHQIT